jgi:conjugal transfer ATP-binding protein TraC
MGSGVGRLILDPFSMLLYSTRAEDYQAIKTLTDRGVPVAEAIETIIERRSGA